MNKTSLGIAFIAIASALSPRLLEQLTAQIQPEPESTLSADDVERLESAKKKRARKLERNKKHTCYGRFFNV